jgi:hypothetical protein
MYRSIASAYFRKAVGPLGRWAVGPLGRWAVGPLGRWAVGPLGRWAVGPLGRWAAGCVAMFDVTNKQSFESLPRWSSGLVPCTARSAQGAERENPGRWEQEGPRERPC